MNFNEVGFTAEISPKTIFPNQQFSFLKPILIRLVTFEFQRMFQPRNHSECSPAVLIVFLLSL